MESNLTLILIVLAFVVTRYGDTFANESVSNGTTEVEFTKEPYVFPEIHDGNALQPTLDLLLSQKRYHEEMERIYQRMAKKNEKAQHLSQLDAMIFNTRLMLEVDIENLQEYLTTGAPDNGTRKQPWCGASSHSVLNTWRKMKEWSEKMRGERVDAEIDAMVKVADSALWEMDIYQKYADMMYEEMKTTTEMEEESDSFPEE